MPFTFYSHSSLPLNIDKWVKQSASERPGYDKYTETKTKNSISKCKNAARKILFLEIITLGIYCFFESKTDKTNIKEKTLVHYVKINPQSQSSSKIKVKAKEILSKPIQALLPVKNSKSFFQQTEAGVVSFSQKIHDSSPRHGKFLKKGQRYLELELIVSNQKSKGSGSNHYRLFMQEALSKNFGPCQIITDAGWSSHVFHFFMGMSPVDADFGPCLSKLLSYYRKNPGDKSPKEDMGSYLMTMTLEGLEKWRFAVDKKAPFTPMRDFQHLQEGLNRYRENREKWLQSKTLEASALEELYPELREDALIELAGLVAGNKN